MKQTLVRYKVKAERAAENELYIGRVFEQLVQERPAGLRYASFKLEDGVSFVHLVSHESGDGPNPLSELPAFKAFVAGVKDRCEEPPIAVELKKVGAYRLFGE
jgi:hypothetical protein